MTAKPTADLAAMDLYDLALAFREEDSDHHAIYRELCHRDERERRLVEAAREAEASLSAFTDNPGIRGLSALRAALRLYQEPTDA